MLIMDAQLKVKSTFTYFLHITLAKDFLLKPEAIFVLTCREIYVGNVLHNL